MDVKKYFVGEHSQGIFGMADTLHTHQGRNL